MPQYLVTRKFIAGTLIGLTHTDVSDCRYEIGWKCFKPFGGSPYEIVSCEPIPESPTEPQREIGKQIVARVVAGENPLEAIKAVCGREAVEQMTETLYYALRGVSPQ